ncbi:MAG: hypothetical protein ACLTR4_00460 [Gallintestinimicrobium sp.]
MKNKRDRLFFTQLFVPQASQSSQDRRAELEVLLAVPSAQSVCGMEDKMPIFQTVAAACRAAGEKLRSWKQKKEQTGFGKWFYGEFCGQCYARR